MLNTATHQIVELIKKHFKEIIVKKYLETRAVIHLICDRVIGSINPFVPELLIFVGKL